MLKRLAISVLFFSSVLLANEKKVPTLEDLFKVKTIGSSEISPGGKYVAYTVTEANFEINAYITQIWLTNIKTKKKYQLTRGKKSSSNIRWSPDGQWLSFTSSRNNDKNQIYAIKPGGGEAV